MHGGAAPVGSHNKLPLCATEFRNNEQGRIVFMLQKKGEYEEITDERKLRRMLENNYIIKNNIDII